jgi:hypothetical protein
MKLITEQGEGDLRVPSLILLLSIIKSTVTEVEKGKKI